MAMAQSTSVEIQNEFWTAKGIIKDLSSTSVEIRNEFWTDLVIGATPSSTSVEIRNEFWTGHLQSHQDHLHQ